ncbi:MAG: transglutaminase domain-containing protein [Aquihabitans sp.]
MVHPDRRAAPGWLRAVIVVAAMAMMAVTGQAVVALGHWAPTTGLVLGALVAALAVLGLPSLAMRTTGRACVFVSGLTLVRVGTVGTSLTSGSQALLVWVVGAVVTLVATDRLATMVHPVAPDADPHTGFGPADGAVDGFRGSRRRPFGLDPNRSFTAQAGVLVSAFVLLAAILLAPALAQSVTGTAEPGEGPKGQPDRGSTPLRSSNELDMTTRPDLTNEVVLIVTADRDSFLRGEIYDRWDGRRWMRSDDSLYGLRGTDIIHDRFDLGAEGTDEFTQRIQMEASYADLYFGAASAVDIDTRTNVGQRLDGTLTTWGQALGRGTTYTVTSRRQPVSEAQLQAGSGQSVPDQLRSRYAAPPVATDRVETLARQIVTDAGATNDYDRIRAIEDWMGDNTKYSLDAPLSPKGVDVVDHYLFESREGWCEQIASSLVVLARVNGIPARLVTGYVATERDRLTGDYLVRASAAHAWAEVWFPEVGWIPFDPTADVPLAAATASNSTASEWLLEHLVLIVVAGAVVGLVGFGLHRLGRRWRTRRRARPTSWAGSVEAQLTVLGERVSVMRRPGDTAGSYASVVADRYGDPRLVAAGRAVDDALYDMAPPSAEERAVVDAVLAEVTAAGEPPEAEPPPVGGPEGLARGAVGRRSC